MWDKEPEEGDVVIAIVDGGMPKGLKGVIVSIEGWFTTTLVISGQDGDMYEVSPEEVVPINPEAQM